MLTPEQASDWAAERGEKWRTTLAGMEAMLKPVDDPLISALDLNAPCKIADIGCGGGGTTLEVQLRAPAGSVIHGFDISPALLEVARQRGGSDRGTVTFTLADMETVAAPEAPYDRVVSRFGIMFFCDPSAAFSNIRSWLAPGGRFAFAVWDRPAENPWLASVRDVVSEFVAVPASSPDDPGPFRYGNVDTLRKLLDHAGYADVEVNDWRGKLAIGGGLQPVDAANFAIAAFSKFAELLAKSGAETQNRTRNSLATMFSKYVEDGAVRMSASVHIVTGTRPA